MSLATVDQFATFLDLTLTQPQADRAQLLLDLATGTIQRHTRQTIELVTADVAVLTGNSSPRLVLPELPVISVASVTTDTDGVLAEDVDWTFDGHRNLWRGPVASLEDPTWCGIWGSERTQVTVTYTHGWDDIPMDIVGVCLQAAARSWRNPSNVSAESVGQYSVTYGAAAQGIALTPDEKRILGDLRRKWMAEL